MCGIAGYFGKVDGAAPARVRSMLDAQRHRGPDGAGMVLAGRANQWLVHFSKLPGELPAPSDSASRIVLGHNLLAIQDRADAARQPMVSGDLALAFNGEIYNFIELRSELEAEGVRFSTAGDTEVLLQLWKRRGPACLDALRGMFAFAVADSTGLWVVRDPFGIKPLYYATQENTIVFASEIRALHAAGVPRRLDREAAAASAAAGINAFGDKRTLYHDVRQLPPGHLLRVTDHGIEVRRYFSLPPISGDLRGPQATDWLRAALEESVRLHLRSRRKIATCLSGGIDSSGIASLVGQALGDARHEFQAFTICTAGPQDSELELASLVARTAGLRHELIAPAAISASDALEMAVAYEVPNHVIGPINQFLLLRHIAESGATVVLDGQGGDELFSGYPWYAPVLLKEVAQTGGDAALIEAKLRDKLPLDPATMQSFERMFHDPAAWVGSFMWQGSFLGWSQQRVLELDPTRYYLHGGGDWRTFRERQYLRGELQYLLRQEDRLGMWFGLECRVPLVDVPLMRLAARLAPDWLIHDGYLKYPLRAALDRLPGPVRWNTRKRGFWETDRARFPWVADLGLRLAAGSEALGEIFPTLAAEWQTLSFDQHWRLLQLGLLERCGTRAQWRDLRSELGIV